MNKKVLAIGGAENQCHAIKLMRQMGYYVIVVDYDTKCKGRELADKFLEVSTADVDSITKIAKGEGVCGIIAVQSDLGLITASIISQRLGLKGLATEKLELFTDKYYMREFLKNQGFPYPNYKKCKNISEVREFATENGFPFVMKPLDSQGSRGVVVIESEADMQKIDSTIKFSRKELAVITEDYLGDDEYTVEGMVIDGTHYTLAISKKTHYETVRCVSRELYYSWNKEYEELSKKHNALIAATGLPFGITHSEYIKTTKGFVLVEFTARGGGAMISSCIVPAISGWDVEDIYIRQILGLPVDVPEVRHNCAVLKFISLKQGKIRRILGEDKIRQMKEVLYFHLSYKEGDTVRPVINDTNRHGYFIATAENKGKLDAIIGKVDELLEVEYDV